MTNVDCNNERASVRDNGVTNNDDITTTLQQKFYIFGGKSLVIMDPVCRLQLAQQFLQLDDQQNDVVQHQHQQVIRQRRQRRQRSWWCKPWLLRRPAFGQFEKLMIELEVEDPARFQNFVRCEPAMLQEMVERLTPIISITLCTPLFPPHTSKV